MMNLKVFAEVLARFPQSRSTAKTVKDLAEDWPFGDTPEARLRHVYRCVNELSSRIPPIGYFLRKIPKPEHAAREDAAKVYLDLKEVSNYFMSDAIALQLLLGRRSINPTLAAAAALETDTIEEIALARLAESRSATSTLADKIRVVPDGFDRMLATIDPDVLRVVLEALVRNRSVEFDYCSFRGNVSRKKLGILGLVVKDASVYAVGLEGVQSVPGAPLPLHRMSNVKIGPPFHHAPFDIDEWIAVTGGLNHPMGDVEKTIVLELEVAPGSIKHFQERPLGPDQVITEPGTPDGWYHLKVTTKHWYTLTSFLMSFGPYVKVLGPKEVMEGKDGVLAWARGVASLYEAA